MYSCFFCDHSLSSNQILYHPNTELATSFVCERCGHVKLSYEAANDIPSHISKQEEKRIISICLRNEFERRNKKPPKEPYALGDILDFIKYYQPLSPLEKIDNALLNISKATEYVGFPITIERDTEYPYYHCLNMEELHGILILLLRQDYTFVPIPDLPYSNVRISPKGYERLKQLERLGRDSRQCFVAMWLAPEMNDVYESAIKKAIEYREEGESEPRFKAIRIDNKEHTNDINDEIISEIRRSRFMVCDLTGYRGGVYFEAGFAYGLGLEVIYTCREDWLETETKKLYDKNGNEVEMKKEGIHFDLEHRNRIAWKEGDLDEFKVKLTNRIKAVIV